MVIKIIISNRIYYTFVAMAMVFLLGIGVYATEQANSGGGTHDYSEIFGFEGCADGEVLKWNAGAFECGVDLGGSDNDYCSDGVCEGNLNVLRVSNGGSYAHPTCGAWGCMSSYVFSSPHYYGSTNTGTISLGEKDNTVSIRGNLNVGGTVTGNFGLTTLADLGLKIAKVETRTNIKDARYGGDGSRWCGTGNWRCESAYDLTLEKEVGCDTEYRDSRVSYRCYMKGVVPSDFEEVSRYPPSDTIYYVDGYSRYTGVR